MMPPRARSWGRVGRTPVVRVRGRGSGRVSMAGMVCYKRGERSRLIYAVREYHGRKDEPNAPPTNFEITCTSSAGMPKSPARWSRTE